ncbi:MAG: polyphosphate kinase 1, partial [Actinomycetota bacterium]
DGNGRGAAPGARYLNRELSWVAFNGRVLALAEDPDRPLLERAKFLGIVSSNFDEFFQVRVAGLKEQLATGIEVLSPDGLTPREQLEAIRSSVGEIVARQRRVLLEEIMPGLAEVGICLMGWAELGARQRKELTADFHERIFPVLTPLSVDPAHSFPHISNLSVNLAVTVRDPATSATRFARVKVPPLLPRFVPCGDTCFVPMEQVIAAHLEELFPGMEVLSHHAFRPTRDADLDLGEEEGSDLLDVIEAVLRRRRLNPMVARLEVERSMPEESLSLLVRELELEPFDVYRIDGPLALRDLSALYALDRPDLKEVAWTPVVPPALQTGRPGEPADVFEAIAARDVLVHHPYESFAASVETFVDQAARDPEVLAIKQTLYRTSGGDSPIVRALIRAAEAGKQVVALVELKARFDEEANIMWARILEEAGVHVVYGVVGLKTHAKVTLVVRREGEQMRLYCHLGTGNYNPSTATIYEDVGLLTANPDIGADAVGLLNYLTGYSQQSEFRHLLVAPVTLRRELTALIRRERKRKENGRIVLKMNSLVDPDIISALYRASQEGVEIDLIVRGICCLRPGVEGLSERIRVRSIVGRYLEHSRIFRFGSDEAGPDWYIGSADLMPRNLDRRVEALTPVLDPAIQRRLQEILDVNLSDDVLAWELAGDGTWTKVPTSTGVSAHRALEERALARVSPEDRVRA